jgi:gamma-glutamylcyclotransferase (GGCT)/AIG2-like uncharacterized protein YtfP
LIFVYGTLKRGEWNNRLLNGAEFVVTALTNEAYVMRNVGYPLILTKDWPEQQGRVVGEVFAVNDETLELLDRLEGHPRNYKRTPIVVTDRNGAALDVEAYVWQREPMGDIVEPDTDGRLEWKAGRL